MFKKEEKFVGLEGKCKDFTGLSSDLHSLFLEYKTEAFPIRMKKFQIQVSELLKISDTRREEILIKSCEKFSQIYGIPQLTCEVFHLFSCCYKSVRNISKALEYARQVLNLTEKFRILDENTCKYMIHLASLLALQENHKESLILLKKSKKLVESLLSSTHDQKLKSVLFEVFAVNLFNIASENESLKNFVEAEKLYKETLVFVEKHPQGVKLREKIENSLWRVKKNNDLKGEIRKKQQKSESFDCSAKYLLGSSRRIIKNNERHSTVIRTNFLRTRRQCRNSSGLKKISTAELSKKELDLSSSFGSSYRNSSSETHSKREKNKNPFPLVRNLKPSICQHCAFSTKAVNLSLSETKSTSIFPLSLSHKDPSLDTMFDRIESINQAEISVKDNFHESCKSSEHEESKEQLKIFNFFEEKQEILDETQEILQSLEGLDGKKDTIENPKHWSINLNPKSRVLVYQSDIEFDFKPFKVFYKLENSLNQLKIISKSQEQSYKLVTNLPKDIPLSEFINEQIHPRLTIQNNSLKLVDQCKIIIATGALKSSNSTSSIRITRLYPRWKILVQIDSVQKHFDLSEILTSYKSPTEIVNDPGFLMSLFHMGSFEITAERPLNYPFTLLSEMQTSFSVLPHQIPVQVLQIDYLTNFSFLLQAKTDEKPFVPMIIDYDFLTKLSNNNTLTVGKIVSYLRRAVKLSENYEIVLEIQPKLIIKLSPTRESFDFDSQQDEKNPDLLQILTVQPESDLIRASSVCSPVSVASSMLDDIPDYSQLFITGRSLTQSDYDDRIILRFSVYQEYKVYQVYMNYSEVDVLTFTIQAGVGSETIRKFSIGVQTLCEKIGFSPNYILPLGSYILRNMLVIKDHEICYFDLSKPVRSPAQAIDKIASLLKGFLTRKKLKIQRKNLLGKRKIKLSGHIYTLLVYHYHNSLLLRFVSGFVVLQKDMIFSQVIKDGYFYSIDHFFNSFAQLGLRLDPSSQALSCFPLYDLPIK